jgi:RNA polymerase sigma factor (sigma-70 family)
MFRSAAIERREDPLWRTRLLLCAADALFHATWREFEGKLSAARQRLLQVLGVSTQSVAQPEPLAKDVDAKEHIQLLRGNDPDAWAELVNDWSPKLFGYLRRHVPTKEDAQDLLSETFAAAVRAIHGFDGNASLSTWLYALAHNKVVDFWRRTKIESELPETLTVAENVETLDFKEAFRRLPELAQRVLQLRYVEGFGVEEIATVMGRSYKATESLLSRSRALLKQVLREAGITASDLDLG